MKVIIKKTIETTEEVDLDFPLFIDAGDVLDDGGYWDSFYRIEADGSYYRIRKSGSYRHKDTPKYEFEHGLMIIRRELSQYLKYPHGADGAGFFNLLYEMKSTLNAFPKP